MSSYTARHRAPRKVPSLARSMAQGFLACGLMAAIAISVTLYAVLVVGAA